MKALVRISLVTLVLASAGPVLAQHPGHSCPHGGDTIADLQACVSHAASVGHIDSNGILTSLLSKLDAAQAALDRAKTAVAGNILDAFIRSVEAQAGKHIDAHHAAHMVQHAERVAATFN